jgi:hypothetical protein
MITIADQSAVRGAWYLLAFQTKGLAWFDLSQNGFRRSWLALLLSLPLVLYRVALFNNLAPATYTDIPLFAVAVFLAINWMIGVGGLVMFGMIFRQQHNLVQAITITNWLGVLGNLILAMVQTLSLIGLPLAETQTIIALLLLYYLAVQGFALSRIWPIHPLTIGGIVIFLYFVDRVTGALFFQILKSASGAATA